MGNDNAVMSRFKLWFFRELTDEQRNKLFQIQGVVPADEAIQFEAMQQRTLRELIKRAAA